MMLCESAALNMSANLEDSAVATGLENVSFRSNPTEGHCQRMYKKKKKKLKTTDRQARGSE